MPGLEGRAFFTVPAFVALFRASLHRCADDVALRHRGKIRDEEYVSSWHFA